MRQKSKMAKICVKFPLNIHCGGCKSPLPGVSGQRWMPLRRSPWQAEISVVAPIHTIEPYLCRFDAYLCPKNSKKATAYARNVSTFFQGKFREFSRDHKSSEQFVWLNRRHREMETQLAHSSVAFDDTNSASGGVDLGSFSGYGLPWVV